MPIDNILSRTPRVSSKGSMIVHTGTTTDEIPVGADSTYLIANSSASVGMNWNTSIYFPTLKMQKIQSSSLTAAATSISFDSIPQTYDDLVVEISTAKSTQTGSNFNDIYIRINSSSASVYGYVMNAYSSTTTANQIIQNALSGSGNTRVVLHRANVSVNYATSTRDTYGVSMINIPSYRSSRLKSGLVRYFGGGGWRGHGGFLFNSVNAITSITFSDEAAFASGTNITLYGITSS
jgi:hypothetical protein